MEWSGFPCYVMVSRGNGEDVSVVRTGHSRVESSFIKGDIARHERESGAPVRGPVVMLLIVLLRSSSQLLLHQRNSDCVKVGEVHHGIIHVESLTYRYVS